MSAVLKSNPVRYFKIRLSETQLKFLPRIYAKIGEGDKQRKNKTISSKEKLLFRALIPMPLKKIDLFCPRKIFILVLKVPIYSRFN